VGGGDKPGEDLSKRRDAERSKNVDAFGKVFPKSSTSVPQKPHFFLWGGDLGLVAVLFFIVLSHFLLKFRCDISDALSLILEIWTIKFSNSSV
jgi:hypothetical protein